MFSIPLLVFALEVFLGWLIDGYVKWLQVVRHVLWYHNQSDIELS